MTQEDIISGSKLIAEYMGLVYLPFSAELKEKGMKAGYYKTVSAEPNIQEVTQTSYRVGEEDKACVKKINININLLRYHNKNGWKLFEDSYYKYVCRHHGDLRYWNSLDELVPVIQNIEKEFSVSFFLRDNGCSCAYGLYRGINIIQSWDLPNWSNNVFTVVVNFLQTKLLSDMREKKLKTEK